MKRFASFMMMAGVVALLSSCVGNKIPAPTRADVYPGFYEEKPKTLLIMPPINRSSYVNAKEYLFSTIYHPLCEAGYYVIPPRMAMDIFKAESAYDAENFAESSLEKFREVFDCDAVVFSQIDSWTKRGFGIETDIRYFIRSARTGETLFDRTCELYLDLSVRTGLSSNSGLGALFDLAASAVQTAAVDHIVAARKANDYIFSDIPVGPFHPDFGKDGAVVAEKACVQVTVK